LADGADVNAKGKNGWTPLHIAAANDHKELPELLIEKGANVNAKDGIGDKTTARMGEIKDQYLV
jgi:ankyrin repeat protein